MDNLDESSDNDNCESDDENEEGDNQIVVGGQQLVTAGSRRPPMSDADKVALQIIFHGNNAQHWDKKTRINYVALLVDKEERFRHLSRNQVTARYHLYYHELTSRQYFGDKFYRATVSMISEENSFVEHHILAILSDWRRRFCMDVNPYNWMPDQLDSFLQHCEDALQRWTPDSRLDGVLSVEDHARVISFSSYYREFLLTTYCNTWADFTQVEVNTPSKMSGRPDLFLSHLELDLLVLVRELIKNDTSSVHRAFFQQTFLSEVFSGDPQALYGQPRRYDDKNAEVFAPAFVVDAVERPYNVKPLQCMLLASFEKSCWTAYRGNLFIETAAMNRRTAIVDPEHSDSEEDSSESNSVSDSDLEDGSSDSDHSTSNCEVSSTRRQKTKKLLPAINRSATDFERDTLYYILGCSIRQSLGSLVTALKQTKAQKAATCASSDLSCPKNIDIGNLSSLFHRSGREVLLEEEQLRVNKQSDGSFTARDLHTTMIRETSAGSFVYPSIKIFHIFLYFFENCMLPCLGNQSHVAMLERYGNSALTSMRSMIFNSEVFGTFHAEVVKCPNVSEKSADRFCEKACAYFVNTIYKAWGESENSSLNSKDVLSKMSFRTAIGVGVSVQAGKCSSDEVDD